MARSKRVEIYTKLADFPEVFLETAKNRKEAEAIVSLYERKNNYELSIGYGFPYGLPTYIIK